MRRLMLLAFVFGCGDEYEPDCNQPLPSTDEEGAPWPSYSVASAELADCGRLEGYYERRSGSCSDGKRFLDKGGGFVGDTLYFDGETIVGRTEWSDFVICAPWRYGDTRCNEFEVEEIMCP